MEIENSRVASLVTPANGQKVPVENQRNGSDKATIDSNASHSSPNNISLTQEASKLQTLERGLENQPVVDSQRVNTVRSAIDNGTFEINPARIADQMISLEQALTDAR